MMIEEPQLHLISSVVILIAAAVPIYLTLKLNGELSAFIFVHAIYQIVGLYGFDLLADSVFEPLSAAVLIYFGVIYYVKAKPKRDTSIKNMVVAWSPATLILIMNSLTIILLLGALSLFFWLTATQSKKIRSFQFQLSIFIIIWIVGDLFNILQNNGVILVSSLRYFGVEVHLVSMFFFSVMLWLRYYYSERSGKRMVENLNVNIP